jgi:hypothetical protein
LTGAGGVALPVLFAVEELGEEVPGTGGGVVGVGGTSALDALGFPLSEAAPSSDALPGVGVGAPGSGRTGVTDSGALGGGGSGKVTDAGADTPFGTGVGRGSISSPTGKIASEGTGCGPKSLPAPVQNIWMGDTSRASSGSLSLEPSGAAGVLLTYNSLRLRGKYDRSTPGD